METRRSILPATWDVPRQLRDRFGAKAGRQRAMYAEEHLLLVLHAPPKPEEDERVARFFWRKPDGSWTSNELGSGTAALRKHVTEYAEAVERCDQREDVAASAEEHFDVLEALAPLHRATRHLHQVLQEARKLCPSDRDIIDFRDRAYDTERSAELAYNGAKNALDFAVARRAEEQARSSHRMAVSAHRLNLLAAFFFPIATLSAVFGVNLRHGYETAQPPVPFLALVVGGLACGVLLTSLLTHKPDR
jgi:hypothetical protein